MAMAIAMVYVERRMALVTFPKFSVLLAFSMHIPILCVGNIVVVVIVVFVIVVVGDRVVVKRCAKVWK